MTHPDVDVRRVLALYEAGLNKSQIARATGLPRTCVREWIASPLFERPTRPNKCPICNAAPLEFPQHGPGRKHERPIVLAEWQQRLVDEHPKLLLRGLIQSDGSRFNNFATARGRRYEYPRYLFTNASDDIRGIFTSTCDALGVHWTQMNARNVSVARREDVAFLDTFIGPKS